MSKILIIPQKTGGSGTVTSVSVVTNQGVSGTVATPTTTPAITLTLGALTGVTSFNGLIITANTGVITTGTWNATTIATNHGGTGLTTFTSGTIYYASSTSVLSASSLTEVSGNIRIASGKSFQDNNGVNSLTMSDANTGISLIDSTGNSIKTEDGSGNIILTAPIVNISANLNVAEDIATGNASNSGSLILFNSSLSNFVQLTASNAISATAYTFPAAYPVSNGQALVSTTAGVWSWATLSTGTVISFSAGNLSPLFSTSVATATTTPALTFTLSSAAAFTILGNNTNVSAVPTYFAPVLASALFANQGTTTTVLHGNASGNPSWSAVVLTTDVSGILPIANGGTNNSASATANTVVIVNSAGTQYVYLANGTTGQVLTANTGGAPSWSAPATSGTVTSVSVTTNQGVSGSVATATTTPNITLSLGALTGVTSVNGLVITANTGVITTGTWNGSLVTGTYGGTGVNNGSFLITVAGNLTTTGAYNSTFAAGGSYTYTLPLATSTLLANNLGLVGNTTLIGGTTASGTLTLESTSGAGSTDYIAFLTGSQSERARITSNGAFFVGETAASPNGERFGFALSSNSNVLLQNYNSSTGTGAQSSIWATSSGGTAILRGLSSGYTTAGLYKANGAYLELGSGSSSTTSYIMNTTATSALGIAVGGSAASNLIATFNTTGLFVGGTAGGTATGYLTLAAGTTSVAPIVLTAGTNLTTATAGNLEYDGTHIWFTNSGATRQEILQIQQSYVTSNFTSSAGTTTPANITGLTATLVAGKSYYFMIVLFVTADPTGSMAYAVAGTTPTGSLILDFDDIDLAGTTVTNQTKGARVTAFGGGTQQLAHSAVTHSAFQCVIKGTVINAGATGTITPQFSNSLTGGSGSIVLAGSYMTVTQIA